MWGALERTKPSGAVLAPRGRPRRAPLGLSPVPVPPGFSSLPGLGIGMARVARDGERACRSPP